MLQINQKKKFISSASKDGRLKFWTPPSSWINYQEMEPLSYKNIDKKENKDIFSDPEDNESDSSGAEDDFDPEVSKKSKRKEKKQKEMFTGMFNEDEIMA